MAQATVNMSLDEIIQENKKSNPSIRGRGGRGGFRGRGQRGGRGGRGGGGRPQASPGAGGNLAQRLGSRARSRSRSRNRQARGAAPVRGNNIGRGTRGRLSRKDMLNNMNAGIQGRNSRSASRNRSVSRNRSQNRARNSRSRSRSRSRINGQPNTRGRGRGNRMSLLKRGISTEALRANKFSRIGLRSDQIARAQKVSYVQNRLNLARNNQVIRSQTFTRSRPRGKPQATQLTVSVANDMALQRRPVNRKRRNSATNQVGYLNQQSLAQLAAILGGGNMQRGPGSVRSMGSNRSRRSNRSTRSNRSQRGGRGRGRGRGNFKGQVLNPRLQKEIAVIQGKAFNGSSDIPVVSTIQPGINFTPTPHLTTTSLSERFSKM